MSCEVSCDHANGLLAQLERAESEASTLREHLRVQTAALAEDLATLRADNERLWKARVEERAEEKAWRDACRAELAAANALLGRYWVYRDRMPADLIEAHRAHRAGQPAAPDNSFDASQSPGGRCQQCWCDECQCPKAAPARTEAEEARATFTTVQAQTLSTCTMADIEVLKELDSIPTAALEHWREHGTVLQCNVAVAELARRGLK